MESCIAFPRLVEIQIPLFTPVSMPHPTNVDSPEDYAARM